MLALGKDEVLSHRAAASA